MLNYVTKTNTKAMEKFTSKLYRKYGGDKILFLKKDDLESISDKLNPFWRDILLNLSELLPPKDEEENDIINILSQPIWFCSSIVINTVIVTAGNFEP